MDRFSFHHMLSIKNFSIPLSSIILLNYFILFVVRHYNLTNNYRHFFQRSGAQALHEQFSNTSFTPICSPSHKLKMVYKRFKSNAVDELLSKETNVNFINPSTCKVDVWMLTKHLCTKDENANYDVRKYASLI